MQAAKEKKVRMTEGKTKQKYLIVNQSIPKFDMVSDLDLVTGLKNLGVTDVFDAEASDFSPMTTEKDQIFVSEVKHAARLMIDEEGCTAAVRGRISGTAVTDCLKGGLDLCSFVKVNEGQPEGKWCVCVL